MFRSGARFRASPRRARTAISTRWRRNISTRTNIPSPSRAKFACCSRSSPPTSAATSSPPLPRKKILLGTSPASEGGKSLVQFSSPVITGDVSPPGPREARPKDKLRDGGGGALTLRESVQCLDHQGRGRTLGVGLLIQLGFDYAVLVEDEDDRPRHAIGKVAWWILRVAQFVAVDD